MKAAETTTKDMFTSTFSLEPHFLSVVRRFSLNGADLNECERVLSNIHSMDEWYPKWSNSAQRFEEIAAEAAKQGKLVTAQKLYFQAFFFYRLSAFPLVEDIPGRRDAYQKAVATFKEGIRLGHAPIDYIEIELEGQSLPAYLSIPVHRHDKAPIVVYIPGADGWKEDQVLAAARPLVERGIACIVVDGPGQGETLALRHIYARHDYESVVTAIINYLESRPEIDIERLAVAGSSMGGYYAPRAAAYDRRIKACVCLSALFDVVEGLFDPYPPIRTRLQECIGAKTTEETRGKYLAFTLKEVVDKIECPCLIIHGGEDIIIPVSEAYRLFDALKSPKEIKIWEDGKHNCQNYSIEARAFLCDWLADRLA